MLGQMLDRRSPLPASPTGTVPSPGDDHVVDRDDDLDARAACGHRCRRFAQDAARRRRSRRGSGRSPPTVAASPTARSAAAGWSVTSSSRSRVSDRWAPRLVVAMAWISSTITVSTPCNVSARRRGEHEIERLGRGDQQVGRATDQPLAFVRLGVAGAHRHLGRGERDADPLGRQPDARQAAP